MQLQELSDRKSTTQRLSAGGLSAAAAADKAQLFCQCAAVATKHGLSDSAGVHALYVPGRIEVLGKHTDYAGGRSMLTVPEKGFCIIVAPRQDKTVRMIRADGLDAPAIYAVDPDLTPIMGHWSNYPMTVARRVARNFAAPLHGADIIFLSDLPLAAGMSSSSALVIVSFLALSAANDLPARPEYQANIRSIEDLAGYLGCNENGQSFGPLVGDKGVGTFGGSEDHTAILTCRNGMLNQYSYCPVKFERRIALPEGYVFAIASSGVEAEKTGQAREKYNRASLLSRAVVETWNKATGRSEPHMAAASQSSPDAPARMREIPLRAKHDHFQPAEMLSRFDHFYGESAEIIPAAGDALSRGDMVEFGRHVWRSQEAGTRLLGNQIPETVFLAKAACDNGAAAASAFGAGFGGAVWALVERNDAESLLKAWEAAYAKAFPAPAGKAVYFVTEAGPAAFELK